MNTITQIRSKCQQYAVVFRNDKYRVATNYAATRGRNLYGEQIIASSLTISEASEWADDWNASQTPDLSDLLVYDQTQEQENRNGAFQEYDIIHVLCDDDFYRTGTVLFWNETELIIEVGSTLYSADKDSAELICKADDWNLHEDDYNEWLDGLNAEADLETPDTTGNTAIAAFMETIARAMVAWLSAVESEAA